MSRSQGRGTQFGRLNSHACSGTDRPLDVALSRELFECRERDDPRDSEIARQSARAWQRGAYG